MTPEQLEEIRRIANAAEDGPWVSLGNQIAAEVKRCTCAGNIPGYGHEQFCGLDGPLITGASPDNAKFMANARQWVPLLLEHVDTLAASLDRVRELHKPNRIYDECLDPGCKSSHIEIIDYPACEESFQGYACSFCCFQNTDYMQPWCPHGLRHEEVPKTLCCPTREAIEDIALII